MTEPQPFPSGRDELEALLPFYLNGTLAGADLDRVEAWLASDPAAMDALAEAEAEMAETVAANEVLRPPADALGRFSRALEGEARARPHAAPSVLTRWWSSLAGAPAGFAWAVAAAAIAILIVQAAIDITRPGGEFEVAGTGDDSAKQPFLLVTFKPDAAMTGVAAFLADNGATIVGGPTAGGVFRIAVPAKDAAGYERLRAVFAAAPFSATVTPGRGPAP